MNKNYYDVLQINRNASPEIIEKAYKVLAKKYHPDLQAQENKKQAEEILKEINEAYEILSNPEKKKEYDFLLLQNEKVDFDDFSKNSSTSCSAEDNLRTNGTEKISKEDFFQSQQQELLHKQQLEQQRIQQELAYQEQLQQARQKAYHDAYIQDLKNRGYKIRYRKSLKDYVRILVTFVVVILVLFLLWQLPFVKNFFVRLYEENNIIHYVVNLFSNLFLH